MITRFGAFFEDSITPEEKDRRYRVLIFDQKSDSTEGVRTVFTDSVVFEPRVTCATDEDFDNVTNDMTNMINYVNSLPAPSLVTIEQHERIMGIHRDTTYHMNLLAVKMVACGVDYETCIAPIIDPSEDLPAAGIEMTDILNSNFKVGDQVTTTLQQSFELLTRSMITEMEALKFEHNKCKPTP